MRVGVVGAGLMGSLHARLLASAVPGAEPVAIADPAPAPVADELGIPRREDPLALIADPGVDAVVIASPVDTHEPFVHACLQAGKRVLCEKPLAPSAAAARRIAEADAAGLVTVGFMRRFDPGYLDLKARLDAGAIGAPLLMHCAHRNPSVHPFFDTRMIITDSAVHEIDAARWLLDDEIAAVRALAPRSTRHAREGLRDPLLLVLETAGGRLVDVEAFVSAGFAYDIRCEVVGEDGTLELLPPATTSLRTAHTASQPIPPSFQERFRDAYVNELRAWVTGAGGATAWDGYAATAVAEAALVALETRRAVEVKLPRTGD